MLNKNAKKWVKALHSGKYKQTKGSLKYKNGYCCLGVACEISKMGKWDKFNNYCGTSTILPGKVKKWLGLNQSEGMFKNRYEEDVFLSYLNDTGSTFKEIADIIESEPSGLFK